MLDLSYDKLGGIVVLLNDVNACCGESGAAVTFERSNYRAIDGVYSSLFSAVVEDLKAINADVSVGGRDGFHALSK
jgi:hypothetical protein